MRQVILDQEEKIVAFSINKMPSENASPIQNLKNTFNEIFNIGVNTLLAKTIGFINIDSTISTNELIELIPPNNFSLVFTMDSYILQRSLGKIKDLHEKTYNLTLRISDYKNINLYENYFNYFSYLELNSLYLNTEEIDDIIKRVKLYKPSIFISNIKTQELFEHCKKQGAELFQGNYIAKPFITEGSKVSSESKIILELLNLLDSEASISKIAHCFSSYPKLTISLLKFLNSASLFLKVDIQSIKHAILLLGRKQMRQWLLVIAYLKTEDNLDMFANPLFHLVQSRLSIMEILAEKLNIDKYQASFIGSLSLLEPLMHIPMKDILNELTLDKIIKKAILEYYGDLGILLKLVLSAEELNYEEIDSCLKLLDLKTKDFQEALILSYKKDVLELKL